jgi:hypothetical protein
MRVVKLELRRPSVQYVTQEPLLALTDMQLQSTLTCPKCTHQAIETMPTNACQFFYDCKGCGERLKPSRAIAACFALTDRCRARRYRATCAAACRPFTKPRHHDQGQADAAGVNVTNLLSRSFPENCVEALTQPRCQRSTAAFVNRIVGKADLNIVAGATLVATNR